MPATASKGRDSARIVERVVKMAPVVRAGRRVGNHIGLFRVGDSWRQAVIDD